MENNGGFTNTHGGSGMLGLEMSLNHQQSPNFHHHHHHQQQQQPPFSATTTAAKQAYTYTLKQRASPISDEEEPHSNNLNNNPTTTTTDDSGGVGGGDGRLRKGSPWQRMKWTDNMVRLLIMVVFYVGDEVSSEQVPSDTAVKKKSGGGGGGGGVLQKKGKWKSVSRAMMERGFNVSPQQCEDKFNDLNKRYKRVNEILGKGTACKVVENQSLLESMDHIPMKLKEEVKKLLNSKHLFFREMCAYHNSCSGAGSGSTGAGAGAGGSGAVVAHHSASHEVSTDEQLPHHKQKCVHSNDEEDEDDEDDEYEDEDGDHCDHYHKEEDEGVNNRKRCRLAENEGNEGVMHQFMSELSYVVQDSTKSVWEKRQWMKVKIMQIEERRLGFEGEAYELEKRRLRWVKFCWSREREMEVEKLRNERMKLENERMVILLRQKEMELGDVQY